MVKKKPKRSFFLRGLVALLPALLTIFAFVLIIQFTQRYVTGPINSGIDWVLKSSGVEWTPPQGVGILVALLLLISVGYLASGFLGRRVVAWFDRQIAQIPLVRSVYPYAKQFVEYFISDSELDFDTVVAAPYPNSDIYSLAFVTSPGFRTIHESLGGRYVSCFVPTSPMPMTGYTVFIEASRLIPLSISVDEALRTTISAGVLIPPNESVEELTQNLAAILGRPLDAEA